MLCYVYMLSFYKCGRNTAATPALIGDLRGNEFKRCSLQTRWYRVFVVLVLQWCRFFIVNIEKTERGYVNETANKQSSASNVFRLF